VVAAAALSATSIGISARVLSDLGQLETREGQVVLGAAVLDDVIGLVILSVVGAAAAGAGVTAGGVLRTTAVAVGFIVAALVVGRLAVPPLFRAAERMRASGTLVVLGLALAFGLAYLAESAGSALIIGAFAAASCCTRRRSARHRGGHHHGRPPRRAVFFAVVGASVDVRTLGDARTLAVAARSSRRASAGKVAAGYAPCGSAGRRR
jgi:Kef-type K+ transport system membrane component KefB